MAERSLGRSTKVPGLIVTGLFIGGVSLFGLGSPSSELASYVGRDMRPPTQVQQSSLAEIYAEAVPRCRKSSVKLTTAADESNKGTLSAGLNCTGAPTGRCLVY